MVMADVSGPPPLTLRFLGACEVMVHGRPLPALRYRKDLWLLALLALRHDREVARDGLAALFWPDAEESQALYYLRRSLSNLRRALGSEARRLLTPTPRTVRLDLSDAYFDVLACDAALAQAAASAAPEEPLQQAISLHRGPLLPDCLEEWALTERNQREEAYLAALERLAQITREKGEPAAAVRWLRLLVASDPYRESAACSLLQALADSGDRAAMQQVYQELRLRLRNDLNAAPAPETEALYQRLNRRGPHPPVGLSAPPASTPKSQRHLPVPLTDLIGREQEIEEVVGRLGLCRLVTLFGTGGVGKTRLAIAVAERVLPLFPDGVWLIDLAPLTEASLVAKATARALGLREEEGRSAEQRLTEALTARALLLVLDNCEHVLDACAALSYHLLSTCPGLRVLATSRHVLRVVGEQVYPVPSLALPPAELIDERLGLSPDEKDPASLLDYAGIRLFVQRAVQAHPTFKLDRRNGAAVAEICRHLDGIPLAIEMAAARLRSLSVSDINTRLSDRFRLLTRGNRAVLPRQQTLRSALDWSYDLLNAEERDLLCRLAVFAGGCTLEGAEAVCSGLLIADCRLLIDETGVASRRSERGESAPCSPISNQQSAISNEEVLDLLTSLVDKSLVVYEDGARGEPRYRMLETVREYGLERLEERGERAEARRLHRDYYLHRVEAANAHWETTHDGTWLAQLGREQDNLRVALDYGQEAQDTPNSWNLLLGLTPYWEHHGSLSEGRQRWAVFLAAPGAQAPTRNRLLALNRCTWMAYQQSDYDAVLAHSTDAARLSRKLGDREEYARAVFMKGTAYRAMHEHELSKRYYEESVAVWREMGKRDADVQQALLTISEGDTRHIVQEYLELMREAGHPDEIAGALHNSSYQEYLAGNYARAQTLCEEALQLYRSIQHRMGELVCLQLLGWLRLAQGDHENAKAFMLETLILQAMVERKQELMTAMQALGDIAVQQGQWERAVCLYSLSEAMIKTHKLTSAEGRAVSTDAQLAQLRATLDTAAYDRAWAQGQSLTSAQAIEYALSPE